MEEVYHAGERAVQERAGVREMARRVGNGIHAAIPPVAQEFLARQPFAVVGAADGGGRVWATMLAGGPGFLRAVSDREVEVDALPPPGDPLRHALGEGLADRPADIGALAIELATRKRMRLNGRAAAQPGGFAIHVRQVYSNCPKYIQAREVEAALPAAPNAGEAAHGQRLTGAQLEWVTRADTFFIASAHPEGGADASHRGGMPGFVRAEDDQTLAFPDYSGNMMFNTLGNLAADPSAGLLFVDFDTGNTLQLTGRAEIIWDEGRAARFPGAERMVEFRVEEVVQIAGAVPLRWRLRDYSPFNPKGTPEP